jgi:integrase
MKRRGRNEGSVTFLASRNAWVASVYEGLAPNGKAIYRKVQRRTKTEALKALTELKRDLESGHRSSEQKLLLGPFLVDWLENQIRPSRTPKTYRAYEQSIRLYLIPVMGNHKVSLLTPKAVTEGLKAIHSLIKKQNNESGRSGDSMVRNTRAVLRSALTRAVSQGLIGSNPVQGATLELKRRSQGKFLTPDECKRLMVALKGSPIEDITTLILTTGVRIGEATGVRIESVHLDESYVSIERQLQRVNGEFTLLPVKSEAGNRNIPLNPLSRAVAERALVSVTQHSENPLELLFLNEFGRPFDQKYINKHLHIALETAGIERAGIHALRHAAATTLLSANVPLHTVSRMLGHSSIQLTANTYGHVLDSAMREAAEQLQQAYS